MLKDTIGILETNKSVSSAMTTILPVLILLIWMPGIITAVPGNRRLTTPMAQQFLTNTPISRVMKVAIQHLKVVSKRERQSGGCLRVSQGGRVHNQGFKIGKTK